MITEHTFLGELSTDCVEVCAEGIIMTFLFHKSQL